MRSGLLLLMSCQLGLALALGCRGSGLGLDLPNRTVRPVNADQPKKSEPSLASTSPMTSALTTSTDFPELPVPLVPQQSGISTDQEGLVFANPAERTTPAETVMPVAVAPQFSDRRPLQETHPKEAAEPPMLKLSISGVRAKQGPVRIALFTDATAFPNSDAATNTMSVNSDSHSIEASIPRMGRLAVAVFQDLNSDGQLNRNRYGIPLEPYAFSNNARGSRGPPSFAEAVVETDSESRSIAIALSTSP